MLQMKAVSKGTPHYQELVLNRLRQVIQEAHNLGVVATIELEPLEPLAMGHYRMVPHVRPARAVEMSAKHPQLCPTPDYGDLMTAQDWEESVGAGCFIPNDGVGHWATKDGMDPNSNCFDAKPDWATHVVWFNK